MNAKITSHDLGLLIEVGSMKRPDARMSEQLAFVSYHPGIVVIAASRQKNRLSTETAREG